MGCLNSKGKKEDLTDHTDRSKGPNSTKGNTKKPNLMDEASYTTVPPPPQPGIMNSSYSTGKKEGLAHHAGYANQYGYDDNNSGSKGSNSTKGRTKKPNLADAAGYIDPSPPTQKN